MENKVKICLLAPGNYPVPATAGGAVEKLMENMLQSAGASPCELHVISPYEAEAEKKSAEYPDVKFKFIPDSPFAEKIYDFAKKVTRNLFSFTPVMLDPYFKAALKIIREEKYDFVVSENGINYINPLKKHTDSKVIFHIHNTPGQLTPLDPGKLMQGADAVITVSDYVAKRVKKNGYGGKIITFKNVTDTERFREGAEKRDEIRKKYGFADHDFVVIFVGRLIAEKGIMKLINAMELVADENVKLLVVGGTAFRDSKGTEFEAKLKKKADAAGKRIVFAGFTEYEKLPFYYHSADAAVFPSLWEEAAGLVVIEAMSAGLPVILSDSGGMREYSAKEASVVVKRDDDFTLRLAKAIKELSKNPEKCREMSAAAVEYSKEFSKKEYGRKLIKLLTEIEL